MAARSYAVIANKLKKYDNKPTATTQPFKVGEFDGVNDEQKGSN
jgi:hypothetical protein